MEAGGFDRACFCVYMVKIWEFRGHLKLDFSVFEYRLNIFLD